MSVLTSNVQFNKTEVKGQMHYTEVSFTYRGRSYVAEVQHNTYNDAVIISDIHNPSNFNPLKSPKKSDIEHCLINEYRKHIAVQTNTITVGSISKFSITGSREVESEAAGKYTVYDVEFEYNASMYNAQIVKTANGLTSFSYMCKKDSMCRSTLATMDEVRTEVRQAFNLATAATVNEADTTDAAVLDYAQRTAEHMTTNTVVKEDTMQVLTEPVLMLNKFDIDKALKHFEEVSGLRVTTLWDNEQQKIYFMTDSHIFVPFELRELQDRHRTLYGKLTHTFRLNHQVKHRHTRIDKIASLLSSNGYNVVMSNEGEAFTVNADGLYRYVTIAEVFFLESTELVLYVDALFAEGVQS